MICLSLCGWSEAGITNLSLSEPAGDSLAIQLSSISAPHALLGGSVGSSTPFTFSLTVDTAGTYFVYSDQPSYMIPGDTGIGGLVNSSINTCWRSYTVNILTPGSTFTSLRGAASTSSPTVGLDATSTKDRQGLSMFSEYSPVMVKPGDILEFAIEVNLGVGTTVFQESFAAAPEPASVIMTGTGLAVAFGAARARRRRMGTARSPDLGSEFESSALRIGAD